jgi:hypothetical protein
VLVGSRRAVAIAVKNHKAEARFTGLAENRRDGVADGVQRS